MANSIDHFNDGKLIQRDIRVGGMGEAAIFLLPFLQGKLIILILFYIYVGCGEMGREQSVHQCFVDALNLRRSAQAFGYLSQLVGQIVMIVRQFIVRAVAGAAKHFIDPDDPYTPEDPDDP